MVLDTPKLARMLELVGELEGLGMKVHLDTQLGTITETKNDAPKDAPKNESTSDNNSKQREGTRKYWEEVTKIQKEENCNVWEARQKYAERHPKEAVNVADNPDAFRQKMSVLKKQYWERVAKLAKERGISKLEARNILTRQGREEPTADTPSPPAVEASATETVGAS